MEINGQKLRQERERRALTQEQLSERAQLGVRTVRRLEAGHGSLEAVRRVTEALQLEPEDTLRRDDPRTSLKETLEVDALTLEFGRDLVMMDTVIEPLLLRISEFRRTVGLQLGIVTPGVRLRDDRALSGREFRVLLRDHVFFQGEAGPDAAEAMVAALQDCVSTHAEVLLGLQELHSLLQGLNRPALVEAVIPSRLDLPGLAAVLRKMLATGQSIRDLGWILEVLAQQSTPLPGPEALAELLVGELSAFKRRVEGTS